MNAKPTSLRLNRPGLAPLLAVAALAFGGCGYAAVAQPPELPAQSPAVVDGDPGQRPQPVQPVEPDEVLPEPADPPVEADASRLLGAWLGPVPGDQGRCGTASGAFFFQSDATYAYNQQTMECGGFTSTGTYAVTGSSIAFQQLEVVNCPTCTQMAQFSVSFSFVTADSLEICDPAGCWTYHRQ
jgi:hypothetical protein